jgi:hypothetical protein
MRFGEVKHNPKKPQVFKKFQYRPTNIKGN